MINAGLRYEIKAEAFRLQTGMLAPGKDQCDGAHIDYERELAWKEFQAEYRKAFDLFFHSADRVFSWEKNCEYQKPSNRSRRTQNMTTSEIITARNEIARASLDGVGTYAHEAIGPDDGDINAMEDLTGLPLVHRAESNSDVAVYSDHTRHVLVADANGPIAIRIR
jgi:hypothetical protein